MASETDIPENLGAQAPLSTEESEKKSPGNPVGGSDKSDATSTAQAETSGVSSTTDDGVRQRLGATPAPAGLPNTSSTPNPPAQVQPPAPIPNLPPRLAEPPAFQITQNQMASAFLTAISILLAIAFAFLFIQFRIEYKLSQLSKLSPSPSPFLKLKNSLTGASSQPTRRLQNRRYEQAKVPEPEPHETPDPDRFRATAQTKDKYPFLKDDPKRSLKQRGVDPEYEVYAQQLQLVLGNLKEAVKKIDESANITEIAGLVKMKPNHKEDKKEKVIKIEDEHTRLLIDDDDVENTVIGDPDSDEVLKFKKYTDSDNLKKRLENAGVPNSMSNSDAAQKYERLVDIIENHKARLERDEDESHALFGNPDEMSEEEFEQQIGKLADYMEDRQLQETKQYLEAMLKAEEPADPDLFSENPEDLGKQPVADPYDDIMAYRRSNSKRDMELAEELEDKMVDGLGDRDVREIVEDLGAQRKERLKLVDRLVNHYFQSLGEEERQEMQEQYKDIVSVGESKAEFQRRLQDTLFGELGDGEYDENIDFEDLEDPKAVFDKKLNGDITEDAKELLDSIPETERDWIYKSLKLEQKMEQEFKGKIIREIQEDRKKEKEDEGNTLDKTANIAAE